jgi:hypothetical protein
MGWFKSRMEIYSNQITLKLEGFVVPEFPLHLILPLLIIATLIAVTASKRNSLKPNNVKRIDPIS